MSSNYLPDILETAEPERLATGFKFTEGPLWHPDGFWYFVDLRSNRLHRIRAGQKPELVRETGGWRIVSIEFAGQSVGGGGGPGLGGHDDESRTDGRRQTRE